MRENDLSPHSLLMYGASWCPDCTTAEHVLRQEKVIYQYKKIDDPVHFPTARAEYEQLMNGSQTIPLLVVYDRIVFQQTTMEAGDLVVQLTTDTGTEESTAIHVIDQIVEPLPHVLRTKLREHQFIPQKIIFTDTSD